MYEFNDSNVAKINQECSKSKKIIKICLVNNRYHLFRQIAELLSMNIVSEKDDWNVMCSEFSVSLQIMKSMKRYQRINHFPGCMELSRKDFFANNLNRMLIRFPDDYNIFPPTWCLQSQFRQAVNCMKRKKCTFIMKPATGMIRNINIFQLFALLLINYE